MRFKFPLLLAVMLMVVLLPFAAAAGAAPITDPLDLTGSVDPASGEGWAWDAGTKTLTLSGLNLAVMDDFDAIWLPDGARVVLVTGSENSISSGSGGSGIYCDGSLVITGQGKISIQPGEAIYAEGSVTFSNCSEVSILSEGDAGETGIFALGDVTISNCDRVSISATCSGISAGGSVVIAGCPDIDIEADWYEGIIADGSVTITNSALTVTGPYYGILTGLEGSGGDITITSSFVDASCGLEGFAAIFAGDDGQVHSKILLNGCVITAPGGGRVVDGDSSIYNCQTITGVAGITVIRDWGQMAWAVVIQPVYTLTYNANGGSGTLAVANSPYVSGSTVPVLPSAFAAPAGSAFAGWNTKANGSGTAYAPGATFAIAKDTTLYAQYCAFTVTFDSKGGSDVAGVTSPGGSTIAAPAAPIRKGYTFAGWYKDAAYKNAWNFTTDKVEGNITLYAKWDLAPELPAATGSSAFPAAFPLFLLGSLLLLLYRKHKEYA